MNTDNGGITQSDASLSVLFVYAGNICRLPTAHAVLVHEAREAGFAVRVESAAISNEGCGVGG